MTEVVIRVRFRNRVPHVREEHMKKSILTLALVAAVAAARRAIKQVQDDKQAKDQSTR